MRTRVSTALAWLVLGLFAGLTAYGIVSEDLISQPVWAPEGLHRFLALAALYAACFAALSLWRPALALPFVASCALVYGIACVGALAFASVLVLLSAALVLGRVCGARGVVAVLLGLCGIVWVTGILVRFPVNYPVLYLALLAAPIAWQRRMAWSLLRDGYHAIRRRAPEPPCVQAALGALGWPLLAHFLVALKPEVSADGLAMHLAIPARVASAHWFDFEARHLVWAVMPSNGDWGFTAAYMLGGEFAARLFNFSMLLLAVVLLARVASQWLPRAAALLVAALFASTPLAQQLTGSLFVENFWAALLLAALVALADSGLPAAAVLLGTAVASKHGALAFAAAMAPLFVLRLFRGRKPREALAVMALFLLAAAPPYLVAWFQTGNPVFPFLNAVFRSPYFDASASFADHRFLTPLAWSTPYDLTFRTASFMESQDGALGFHYFLLLPLSLVLLRRDWPWLAKAALWCSATAFPLAFSIQSNVRYGYPALLLSMIPVAAALSRIEPRRGALYRTALGTVAAAFLLNLYFLPASGGYHKQFVPLTAAERESYLLQEAPVRRLVEYLNRMSPGSPAAFIESNQIAGFHGTAYTNTWHNDAYRREVSAANSASECLEIMKRLGISRIVAPTEASGIVIRQVALQSLLGEFAVEEYRFGDYHVARLKKEYTSPGLPLREASAGHYDDISRLITFTGPWIRDTQFDQPWNHTLTYTDRPGSALRFSFQGSEVAFLHTKAFNRGIASVTIDGVARGDIDLYSPETVWRARATFGGLQPGSHILEIAILPRRNPSSRGGFVDLDALEVR